MSGSISTQSSSDQGAGGQGRESNFSDRYLRWAKRQRLMPQDQKNNDETESLLEPRLGSESAPNVEVAERKGAGGRRHRKEDEKETETESRRDEKYRKGEGKAAQNQSHAREREGEIDESQEGGEMNEEEEEEEEEEEDSDDEEVVSETEESSTDEEKDGENSGRKVDKEDVDSEEDEEEEDDDKEEEDKEEEETTTDGETDKKRICSCSDVVLDVLGWMYISEDEFVLSPKDYQNLAMSAIVLFEKSLPEKENLSIEIFPRHWKDLSNEPWKTLRLKNECCEGCFYISKITCAARKDIIGKMRLGCRWMKNWKGGRKEVNFVNDCKQHEYEESYFNATIEHGQLYTGFNFRQMARKEAVNFGSHPANTIASKTLTIFYEREKNVNLRRRHKGMIEDKTRWELSAADGVLADKLGKDPTLLFSPERLELIEFVLNRIFFSRLYDGGYAESSHLFSKNFYGLGNIAPREFQLYIHAAHEGRMAAGQKIEDPRSKYQWAMGDILPQFVCKSDPDFARYGSAYEWMAKLFMDFEHFVTCVQRNNLSPGKPFELSELIKAGFGYHIRGEIMYLQKFKAFTTGLEKMVNAEMPGPQHHPELWTGENHLGVAYLLSQAGFSPWYKLVNLAGPRRPIWWRPTTLKGFFIPTITIGYDFASQTSYVKEKSPNDDSPDSDSSDAEVFESEDSEDEMVKFVAINVI